MAKAIARVTNDSETDQARHTALAALRVLVEPIDNANGELEMDTRCCWG